MRIGAVAIVVWLIFGVVAGAQRGYFDRANDNCAKLGTVLVTVAAGPLNYFGVNPRVHCEPSRPSSQ